MDPSLVPYDWLYGFAALIVVIMMLLCLAPMLGSRPRVLHCPPGHKSTSPARNEAPVDMVEMVSLPRAKQMPTNKQTVRLPVPVLLLKKHVSDGTLPGFSKFTTGITTPTFPRTSEAIQKQSSNLRGQNFLRPEAPSGTFYVNLATNSYSSLP